MLPSHPLITDPTWTFFLVLAVILLAPLLARRVRIPHIIALMLAGVLIGPHGLNLVARDRSFELFGQVGIYYIMFLAALELNMGSVEHYGRRGLQFGLLTFLIPMGMGVASAHYLLGYGMGTSLLLGCVLGSHTLVTYPIVSRYGLGRYRSVVISVVATAIAIFLALLTVAVVVGRMRPDSDWQYWALFALKCVLYGAFVIVVFPRLGRWFLRRYDDSVLQYIFILSLVFLSAALAELAGLEGLLGAFMAGLAVNRLIPRTSPLMNRIEFVGNALFIPYFLIGVGMIIDIYILVSDWRTIWVVTVMVVTATLSKWLAAEVMRLTSKGGRYSCMLMFGLTNAHAAGALAIVMIGTAPGIELMDGALFNATVMLILFSCIISSLATNYGAQQTALRETTLAENQGSFHGKCLIAYSQEHSVAAMTQMAMLIRNPYIPESIIGLNVIFDDGMGENRNLEGQRMLEKAQEMADAADVPMTTMNRVSTNIASGILHAMVENECGEVVVCLTDRATEKPKPELGNVIENLLTSTHREVIALRSIVPPNTLRRVLVCVPEKAEYEVGFYKWLEHVCRIGEQLDCRLDFHAHPDTLPYIREYMRQKHSYLRSEYLEMPRWSQIMKLSSQVDRDHMVVFVTARQGSISYQKRFDTLPLTIHRYFGQTSVMLLYPDQWGDPQDTMSIFAPNGRAVNRQGVLLRGLFGRERTRLSEEE